MKDWPEPDQDAWLAYLDHFDEPNDDYYQRLEETFYEEEARIRTEANVGADEGEAYYALSDNDPYCPSCGVCNGGDCGCSCHYGLTKAQEAFAQAEYEDELAMGEDLAKAEGLYEEAQIRARTTTAIASTRATLAAAKAKAAFRAVRAALVFVKFVADTEAKVKVKLEAKSSLADAEEAASKAYTTLATAEEAKSTLIDSVDALVQFYRGYDEEDPHLIEVKAALIEIKVVLADAKVDLTKAKAILAEAEAEDAIANAEAKTEIKNTLTLAETEVAKARLEMKTITETKAKVEVSVEQEKNQRIEARDVSKKIEEIAVMYENIMNTKMPTSETAKVSTLANAKSKLAQDPLSWVLADYRSESEAKTYAALTEAKTALVETEGKSNVTTFAILTETEAETLAKAILTEASAEAMVLAEALVLTLAEAAATTAEVGLTKLTNELSCSISVLKECRQKSFRISNEESKALAAAEEGESALAAVEEARNVLTANINALNEGRIKVCTLTVDLTFVVLTEDEALAACEEAKVKALTEAEVALVEATEAKVKVDLDEAVKAEANTKTAAIKALVEAAESQAKADLAQVQAYLVKALASASKVESKVDEYFTNADCDRLTEVESLSNVLIEVLAKTYTTESTLEGMDLANAILAGSKVKIDEVLGNAKYAYAES